MEAAGSLRVKGPKPGDVRAGARPVQKLRETTTAISGNVQDLQRRLKQLEEEIKVDREGQKGHEDAIAALQRQRADLQHRIDANKKWIANFSLDVGPFEQKYNALVGEIHGIYDNAKDFHAKGIQMLIDEFNYHVAFKRWDDTFSAVPFKPK